MLIRFKMFLKRDWSTSEKVLMLLNAYLLGSVLGFLFAPIKKGIYCGNHNGNNNVAYVKDKKPKVEKAEKAE